MVVEGVQRWSAELVERITGRLRQPDRRHRLVHRPTTPTPARAFRLFVPLFAAIHQGRVRATSSRRRARVRAVAATSERRCEPRRSPCSPRRTPFGSDFERGDDARRRPRSPTTGGEGDRRRARRAGAGARAPSATATSQRALEHVRRGRAEAAAHPVAAVRARARGLRGVAARPSGQARRGRRARGDDRRGLACRRRPDHRDLGPARRGDDRDARRTHRRGPRRARAGAAGLRRRSTKAGGPAPPAVTGPAAHLRGGGPSAGRRLGAHEGVLARGGRACGPPRRPLRARADVDDRGRRGRPRGPRRHGSRAARRGSAGLDGHRAARGVRRAAPALDAGTARPPARSSEPGPCAARCTRRCSTTGARRDRTRRATAAGRRVRSRPPSLRREGDVWAVTYDGSTVRIRALKGIADLAVLRDPPGEEVHCLELMGAHDVGGDAGPGARRQGPTRSTRAGSSSCRTTSTTPRRTTTPLGPSRPRSSSTSWSQQLTEAHRARRPRPRRRDRASSGPATAVTYRIRAADQAHRRAAPRARQPSRPRGANRASGAHTAPSTTWSGTSTPDLTV